MIIQPLLWGLGLGLLAAAVLLVTGMIRERSGAAVALIFLSAFWVVFSIVTGGMDLVLHVGVLLAFTAAAICGYLHKPRLIVLGAAWLVCGKRKARQ